jgi:outer membrane protein assembly factor BamB
MGSKLFFFSLLAQILLLYTFYPGPAHAQSSTDWPTKGKSLSRSYFVPEELPLNNNKLNLKWSRFFGERLEVDMEPVVVGNTVYIGVMNGKLYALNKDTGDVRWVYPAGGPLTDTPTVATINNKLTVVFGSLDGHVYAVDALTGGHLWKFKTNAPIMSTPSVIDSTVYIGSTDGYFYALNGLSNGQQIWKFPAAGPITNTSAVGSLASGEKIIYFSSDNNVAYALRTNGSVLWTKTMQGAYTKHTSTVVSNNRAIFMTRKPGGEYSQHMENIPTILLGSPKSGPTVLDAWADYYLTYPDRRPLYIFDATTGTDLWQPSVNKTRYMPLYLPYWGQYSVLVDDKGNGWLPSSGAGFDNSLNHDIRLWKLNLATGDYAQHATQDQFLIRFDEVGRQSMIGNKIFHTISEDVGYFDISLLTKSEVFGNGFSSHRYPNELSELPNTIFGGMHKHFPRFGSSSHGAFAGGNDATSPLVVANNQAYVTSWGHLYALSTTTANPTKHYQTLDLVKTSSSPLTPASVKSELQTMAQKLVNDTKPLSPVSRYWTWFNDMGSYGIFWHDGETARSLSDTIPLLDEPLRSQFSTYVKTFIQNNLLNAKKYEYAPACLIYPDKLVVNTECPSNKIARGQWHWSNPNHTAQRLYALYRYGLATNDWTFITTNWSFIKSRYQEIIGNNWNTDAGFFLWEGWIAGNFNPHNQLGAMLAVREMAIKANDTTIRDSANNYLTQMQTKRVYWGKYLRSLYGSGSLKRNDLTDPNLWGYDGWLVPIPKEGFYDETTDYRQPYTITLENGKPVGLYLNYYRSTYPYELISFNPILTEFAPLIKSNLADELQDYIDAIEIYAPWWYLGDYSHQPVMGHEEESMSPKLSVDIFLAKAYVFNQTFDQLAPQLPIGFEDYGHRDMFRYQTLVALLKAPTTGTYPTSTPTPNIKPGDANGDNKVNDTDYGIWRTNYNQTKTGGASIGDFNNNGKVEGLDYVVWLTNYGK